MDRLPKNLYAKLEKRKAENAVRSLGSASSLVDFSSNDYLGFSTSEVIFKGASEILKTHNLQLNGASGSRLLSGNHQLYPLAEDLIAKAHGMKAALIFNSGYDANLGFFSSVPQRRDLILFDELCHASIRDGIRMSNAKAIKFKHNDLKDLKIKYQAECQHERIDLGGSRSLKDSEVYVVTESVFSMDGDSPNLNKLTEFCEKNKLRLVVDEAHALGVLGKGMGLIQELRLEQKVFAQVITFGKALGCHGAAILGSEPLKNYLVNFARSLVYTTALPPHSVATIIASYQHFVASNSAREILHRNIAILRLTIDKYNLRSYFIDSESAIHSCVITGNENVKRASNVLKDHGFNVKPILSPTVPKGQERLRLCVHNYNSEKEIEEVVKLLATFVK